MSIQRTHLLEIGIMIVIALVSFVVWTNRNVQVDISTLNSIHPDPSRMLIVDSAKFPEYKMKSIVFRDSKTGCEYLFLQGRQDSLTLLSNTCGKK